MWVGVSRKGFDPATLYVLVNQLRNNKYNVYVGPVHGSLAARRLDLPVRKAMRRRAIGWPDWPGSAQRRFSHHCVAAAFLPPYNVFARPPTARENLSFRGTSGGDPSSARKHAIAIQPHETFANLGSLPERAYRPCDVVTSRGGARARGISLWRFLSRCLSLSLPLCPSISRARFALLEPSHSLNCMYYMLLQIGPWYTLRRCFPTKSIVFADCAPNYRIFNPESWLV